MAALWAYIQTIQSAFADVENTLVARQKLEEQLMAEQRRVTAYSEYERLAWLQYNGGYAAVSHGALRRGTVISRGAERDTNPSRNFYQHNQRLQGHGRRLGGGGRAGTAPASAYGGPGK